MFYSIYWAKLWKKLEAFLINQHLLNFICMIHKSISFRLRFNPMPSPVLLKLRKALKQDWILAQHLFNFYINSLVGHLHDIHFPSPKFIWRHLFILLYGGSTFKNIIGLKIVLKALPTCFKEDWLELKYWYCTCQRVQELSCNIDGCKFEQVRLHSASSKNNP